MKLLKCVIETHLFYRTHIFKVALLVYFKKRFIGQTVQICGENAEKFNYISLRKNKFSYLIYATLLTPNSNIIDEIYLYALLLIEHNINKLSLI